MAENELEHAVKTLTIDEDYPVAVEALKAEGWELIPGILPVAVFHVVRLKIRPATTDAQLNMVIDESKIGILRNGEIVK